MTKQQKPLGEDRENGIMPSGDMLGVDNGENSAYNNDVEFAEDGSEIAVSKKIKDLHAKLARCMAERQEYLAGWQRAKADYVNARNDEEKNRAQIESRVRESIIEEFLPVLDSFNLSRADRDAWNRVPENWRVGVEYIHTQLEQVLTSYGLREIPAEGKRFDPELHVSIEAVLTGDPEKGDTVKEVVQRGYEVRGKVIRPATVKVWSFKT